ncbi:capsule biosynthesis protein CapA-like [Rhopilema esculentum]|uniref:capsule biosynthesis protein CapA-like n=1 Tax=Rhopilema esculentum TaxID=499914 RepID=UPI0031D88C5B
MNEVPELTRLLTLIFFTFLTVCASSKESKLISDNQTATIIFAGDISFDGPVKYFAEIEKTCDYKRPFERVRKLLATADLRVANLESPLLKRAYGEKVPDSGKTVANCGSIDAVEGLKYAGFDIVQVANNHFADFGVAGVKSTIAALKKAGIAYVGMQDRVNKKTSQKPVIKMVNGLKIGFLSYCLNVEGCSPYRCENGYCSEFIKGDDIFKLGPVAFDKRIARNDIKRLSKRVDFTVVLMHWSKEYSLVPPLPIRQLAESLVVYGANLIIGSHPHVIQIWHCCCRLYTCGYKK